MECTMQKDEFYHHGIKGMKWYVRRFQNKDGSLTPAGKKRYSDDDKSDAESTEQKRARLLKSTDAKELYENRHLLTTNEINERINRLDTEAKLSSRIVEEQKKTGREILNEGLVNKTETIGNIINLYKKIDDGYSTVKNSAIGKTLAKKLGLEPPAKEFDINEFWKNRNKKSTQEIMDVNKRLTAEERIKKMMDAENAEADAAAKLKEAQKQVDDYNKSGAKDDRVGPSTYSKKGEDVTDNKTATGKEAPNRLRLDVPPEKVEGTVEWYDRSKASKYREKVNDIIIDVESVPMPELSAQYKSIGQSTVAGLLEDKTRGGN